MGFYSAFNDFKAAIAAYPTDEILVVSDPVEQYGENWYFCTTEEAKARELDKVNAVQREAEAAAAAAAAEEARKAAEAEALESLIVHEEHMRVRPYTSSSAEATTDEVRGLGVRPSRPLLSVRIQRRRYAFGARAVFNDRESDAVLEFRPRKEPGYDLKRKEMSIGLQACPPTLSGRVDASAQTQWRAPQHASASVDMDSTAAAGEMAAAQPLVLALNGMTSMAAATAEEGSGADSPTRIDTAGLRAMLADAVAVASGLESGSGAPVGSSVSHAGRSASMSLNGDILLAPSSMLARRSSAGGSMGVSSSAGFALNAYAGSGGGKGATSSALERLVDFLYRSLHLCEQALSQNETLNIFRNELTLLAEDEVMVMGNSEAKHIREERQFMDLELSNNKALVAIEWHPVSPVWLAVAAMPRHSLESRVAESGLPRVSHILLYTLTEFSNQLVLEAPADVTAMHWNPRNANMVAVGCVSGQVAVFDMSEAHEAMAARRKATAAAAEGGQRSTAGGDDTSTSTKALHVKPKFVSAVENSHGRSVTGLRWLPHDYHLSTRNQFIEERDGEVSQFVSCGSDGMIAVWDIRYRERTRTRRRASITGGDAGNTATGGVVHGARSTAATDANVLQSALVPGAAAAGVPAPPAEVPWVPQYRVVVRFGAGPVNMTSFILHDRTPSDPLIAGSEDGRVLVIDWAPPGEGTGADDWLSSNSGGGGGGAHASAATAAVKDGAPSAAAAGADGAVKHAPSDEAAGGETGASSGAAMRVLWVSQDNDRPPVAMHRSPFWADTFLTVGDFSFSIWRRGVKSPIFTSSASPVPNTAGRWSPSRPAVVFIGRSDGALDVWDLLDSTTKPSVSFPIMSVPVTSMEFRIATAASAASSAAAANMSGMWATGMLPASLGGAGGSSGAVSKQLLAVGDAKGSLHVLDIPLPLRKGVPNEEAVAAAYLDREAARVMYVATRAAFHEAEKAQLDAAAQREAAAKDAHAAKLEAELQAAKALLQEKDPAAARAFDAAALEAQKAKAIQDAADAAYTALERSIMAELGVTDADLLSLTVLQRRSSTENASRDVSAAASGSPLAASRRGSEGGSSTLKAAPLQSRSSVAGKLGAATATGAPVARRASATRGPAPLR